ncbi:DUF3558 domain-containing protein [Williamsia sterculiae]|uniref:DUF3558 domain-containing protein n=1 Tax=Williamsia sterculiae TaxID=1344003 RepID=UPI00135666AA|nr:DUF3558 domain-containing protein [Williamsia sterculiae]
MFGWTRGNPRRSVALLALAVALTTPLAACSDDSGDSAPATAASPTAQAGSGPFFGHCGNITSQEVTTISGLPGLTNTVNNSSGCEWTSGDVTGPHLSFNWYRGSPIGRERSTEQLSRPTVKDISVGGAPGFLASDLGICEIGIDFGADFVEWSLSTGTTSGQQPLRTTDQLCDSATQLSTLTVQRGQR